MTIEEMLERLEAQLPATRKLIKQLDKERKARERKAKTKEQNP